MAIFRALHQLYLGNFEIAEGLAVKSSTTWEAKPLEEIETRNGEYYLDCQVENSNFNDAKISTTHTIPQTRPATFPCPPRSLLSAACGSRRPPQGWALGQQHPTL